MKCSSIKLCNRKETRRKIYKNTQTDESIKFITQEYHRYSFTFIRNKKLTHKTEPDVKITNIGITENFPSLNNGMSLDKWSKKTPRLRSSRRSSTIDNRTESNSDEYEISFDLNNLLNDLDKEETADDDDNNSTTYIEYDIHSDIEELIVKTQRKSEEYEKEKQEKKKRKKSSKNRKEHEDKAKRKVQKKLKKRIKFSLSKPQSPETEQVIRVDVTSNMSLEDFKNLENSGRLNNASEAEMRGKAFDASRAGLNEKTKEYEGLRLNKEDEDFIILCRKLVISPKDVL